LNRNVSVKHPQFVGWFGGHTFAAGCPMTLEALIGRALAVSVHPVLAWKGLRVSGRIAIVLAYFGAAYLSVLTALFALR
jgi:hypothetical protein